MNSELVTIASLFEPSFAASLPVFSEHSFHHYSKKPASSPHLLLKSLASVAVPAFVRLSSADLYFDLVFVAVAAASDPYFECLYFAAVAAAVLTSFEHKLNYTGCHYLLD